MKTFAKPDQPKIEEKDPTKCSAYGCRCRASVSLAGDGWACHFHAFESVDQWQSVTRGLNDHDWLLGLIQDVRKLENDHKDWRGYAIKFWDGSDDFCKPQSFENQVPYTNRMMVELRYRIGLQSNRPQPKEPKPVKPAGRFADSRASA